MTGHELKTALRAGRRVYGTCATTDAPLWPRALAQAGLDFVFIDTEHTPRGRESLAWMCQMYDALGVPPVVRIPRPDPYLACMALDGGACGIVAPYVERVEEVRALAGAVKLRPLKGARLEAALLDPASLDAGTTAYLAEHNRDNVLIINVESVPAVEALDSLLAIPELDAVLIGPHDLSISMDLPEAYTDPAYTAAIERIIRGARDRGLGAGFHFGGGLDTAIAWCRAGANFIIHSTDLSLARAALDRDLATLRTALGDAADGRGAGARPGADVVV